MGEIQNKWMGKETEYLETWIKSCEDLFSKLDKCSPRAFTNPLNNNSPYPAIIKKFNNLDIDELVESFVYRKLEQHHFPIYKERRMEDIITPPGSITSVNTGTYIPNKELMDSFIVNTIQTHKDRQTSDDTTLINIDRRRARHAKVSKEIKSPREIERAVPVEEYVRVNRNRNKSTVVEGFETATDSDTSESELEIINLDSNDCRLKECVLVSLDKGVVAPNLTASTASEFSSDEIIVPRPKLNYWYDKDTTLEMKICSQHSSKSLEVIECTMKNVYVAVIKEYFKRSKDELHLRIGMKIKQKQSPDEHGMAYGWHRKKKMGAKKYGYYPVDHVIFLQRSSWSALNK